MFFLYDFLSYLQDRAANPAHLAANLLPCLGLPSKIHRVNLISFIHLQFPQQGDIKISTIPTHWLPICNNELKSRSQNDWNTIFKIKWQHFIFSRKECEDVASTLSQNGISAIPYHAGLGPSDRTNAQDRWIKDKVDVICATIAFGN